MEIQRNRDKKNRYLNNGKEYPSDSKVVRCAKFWSSYTCKGVLETLTPACTAVPISLEIKFSKSDTNSTR